MKGHAAPAESGLFSMGGQMRPGLARRLIRLFASRFRHRRAPSRIDHLSDWLRADIGLTGEAGRRTPQWQDLLFRR